MKQKPRCLCNQEQVSALHSHRIYIVNCTLMRTCDFAVLGGDVQITPGTFSNSAQTQRFIGGLGIHHISLNQTVGELHQTTASEESPGSPYLQARISAAHKVQFCADFQPNVALGQDGKMCSDLFCGCHYLCWIVFVRFCLSTWAHMRAKQALKPWKQPVRLSWDFGSIAKLISSEKENTKTNNQVRVLHGVQT